MVSPAEALAGRAESMPVPDTHFVNGAPISPPWPDGAQTAVFALGCFWGAERLFWQTPGVYTTAVGYVGGYTPNPTYQEICTGRTGHTEGGPGRVRPRRGQLDQLFKVFWENHDPTQGMRQGNDIGTQYRSAIYATTPTSWPPPRPVGTRYQKALDRPRSSTDHDRDIEPLGQFFYAEDYHQQYLAKNPGGYCGLGGTGLSCPVGVASVDD